MTYVRLGGLLATQADVVAAWQLRAGGWSHNRIDHAIGRGGWQQMYDGVYVRSTSAPTRRQRWFAAVLTAPGTVLSHASAAVCWGFLQRRLPLEIVSRPGSGGPQRYGRLMVCRSTRLAPHIEWHQGLPLTSAARTLADLSPHLDEKQLGKAFRNSLRLKTTTIPEIEAALQR